jgi:hypothetical protein
MYFLNKDDNESVFLTKYLSPLEWTLQLVFRLCV